MHTQKEKSSNSKWVWWGQRRLAGDWWTIISNEKIQTRRWTWTCGNHVLTHHWYTSKQNKEKRDAQFWERKRAALIEEAKGIPSYPTRERLRWGLAIERRKGIHPRKEVKALALSNLHANDFFLNYSLDSHSETKFIRVNS